MSEEPSMKHGSGYLAFNELGGRRPDGRYTSVNLGTWLISIVLSIISTIIII